MYHIRWMIRRDLPIVLNIEKQSFRCPWNEDDFIRTLRQRNAIGMVVEKDDEVVGFMVYELHKNYLNIINFAVHPNYRRMRVGTTMIEKLYGKLSYDRRNRLVLEVADYNLDAQLFFKQLGFRAISILRDHYEDVTADAYLMQKRYEPSTEELEEMNLAEESR